MRLALFEEILDWINLVQETNLDVLDSLSENIDIFNCGEQIDDMNNVMLDESIGHVLAVLDLDLIGLELLQRQLHVEELKLLISLVSHA